MLSFDIGFVIGFWNLQQFIKSNIEKKIEVIIFRYCLLCCLVNKLYKNGLNESWHGFTASFSNIWNQ